MPTVVREQILETVTQVTALTPTISGNTTICSGNSTTLTANSGYTTYSWSTGVNTQSIIVSTAGTYTVTVSNASGCTGTASATVTVLTAPTATATNNGPLCEGATISLTATPNTFATYS